MIRALVTFLVCFATLVTPAAAQPAPPAGERGRAVFFMHGCYGCHRLGQAGTPIAHDLSHIGRKYTESELVQWVRDPASQKPNAHMPRLALTEDEIRALAHYLASMR